MMILAFTGMASVAMAQETTATPAMKYSVATNSFWSNWFITVGGTYSASYFDEARDQGLSKSPFKSFRGDFGASLAVGKWFTPGLGLRTKLNIWQVKNEAHELKQFSNESSSFDTWNLQEQVMFNLSNMLYGYSETRVWNLIPYVGFGGTRNMSKNIYSMAYSAGILNTWKLSKHVNVNLDIYYSPAEKTQSGVSSYEKSKTLKNFDNLFTAEVGLTFNLGKATWNKVPDVDALNALHQGQIDALNSQLADAQSENGRLKSALADAQNQPKATASKFVGTGATVFFNLGKTDVASRKDLEDVKSVAEYAKANNAKLVVTGYADSQTGSADFNKQISQKRADTIANELVNMGVSRDNIETVAAGGTDTLNPYDYNRRVVVEVK